jgi:hypothetical protein
LEDKADTVVSIGVPIPILKGLGGSAVDEQIAVRIAVQTAYDVEKSSLTASRRTQDGYEFVLSKVYTDPVQSHHGLVSHIIRLLDVFQLKHVFLRSIRPDE